MNILVCGARGFIGRHVAQRLQAAGHTVLHGVSRVDPSLPGRQLAVDFARDDEIGHWLPRLQGVDAVVNAVGVLRSTRQRPMTQVHQRVPAALFAACAQAGVRQVVQVSALGVDQGDTPYARTKRGADEALLALAGSASMRATVLRPSLVYGPGGASAQLFDGLARSPLLVLPAPMIRCQTQPLHVDDLAEGIGRLLDGHPAAGGQVLHAVGPHRLTLIGFIDSLRQQRGHRPARRLALGDGLTRLSAQLADLVPVTPWGLQALALLAFDNVADPAPFAALLGRPARDPRSFACTA